MILGNRLHLFCPAGISPVTPQSFSTLIHTFAQTFFPISIDAENN